MAEETKNDPPIENKSTIQFGEMEFEVKDCGYEWRHAIHFWTTRDAEGRLLPAQYVCYGGHVSDRPR
jgi:hypothetical protein